VVLNEPLTTEELRHAVEKGGKKKAPGRDGISSAFFQTNWEVMKEDLNYLAKCSLTENSWHNKNMELLC
jgi:hypothetical protein